jgi:hypothetical protein
LGAICDQVGAYFMGGDIENWPGKDPRVQVADALDADSYPQEWGDYLVVTSPVYQNKRLGDYCNGPTPNTKVKGRRDYGIGLGRALHPNNLARVTGRPKRAEDYWMLHRRAAQLWPDRCLVNVDSPIAERWTDLLVSLGYSVVTNVQVKTQRYGGLSNADKRADHECLLVAVRGGCR